MAKIIQEPSRTFGEYLLIPNLTTKDCIPENVNLETPIVRYKKGEKPELSLKIPMVSAIMQSVSDNNMAVALAKNGGISFIYGSQSVEEQAEMVRKVKRYKAGFVISDSNLTPEHTLKDVLELKEKTGHSTMAITFDGTPKGKLAGIVTSRDYRVTRDPLDRKVKDFMTKAEDLVIGQEGISLKEANDIIWEHKLNSLPIVDKDFNLVNMVFRKDYSDDKEHPLSLLDKNKSYVVGAGINSRDYEERVPALVEAGADILCIDSSEGFSEWQKDTITWIKSYDSNIKVGAGNVVDREGFRYLADAGADFVKIGIGGGSICITREQKGIGRGQASSVLDVAAARDEYFEETGIYIPICSDGGIVHDYHVTLALAMGADFVMLGRYFARFDESPTAKVKLGSGYVKEYWGEGANRARNWARYDLGSSKKELQFEEGVDSYVPYAGNLDDGLRITLHKVKSTMCNCGCLTIRQLHDESRLCLVSSTSITEGGAHDVILKNQ